MASMESSSADMDGETLHVKSTRLASGQAAAETPSAGPPDPTVWVNPAPKPPRPASRLALATAFRSGAKRLGVLLRP